MAGRENDSPIAAAEPLVDLTAASTGAAAAEVPPELLAQSLGQYLRAWLQRIRSGDSGVLPVLLGIIVVAIAFEIISPENAYLRASNLVYIFALSTVYVVLATAEIVVLLLGEIDLSIGSVALLGGTIAFKLVQQNPGPNWPWWAAILMTLLCCGFIGAIQGTLAARLRIPSFIVTLAGFLLFEGIIVIILGGADGTLTVSSLVPNQSVIFNLVQGIINPLAGWIVLAVLVVIAAAAQLSRVSARRRAGVDLALVRPGAFALCSATAGFGGVLLRSFFFGQYSTNDADPGQLILYSVAAAVIGGTSLFGGRGKPIHGLLGGLMIGGIAYGVSLLSLGNLS